MTKSVYDKMMEEINKKQRLNKKRNYKICKNLDTDGCVLWSACADCYYYEEELICPFCERKVPNKEHFFNGGCLWCQKR